jgi:hypothetical protein
MKLFSGLEQSDYQDVFRAVGALLDEQHCRDVRLWEHEDGVILQARLVEEGDGATYQTYLLTDDDIRDLLTNAYRRRGPSLLGSRHRL